MKELIIAAILSLPYIVFVIAVRNTYKRKNKTMKSEKPYSPGRIVSYVPTEADNKVLGGNHTSPLPATIVNDWPDISQYQETGTVNLKVFGDAPNDLWRTSVPHDQETKAPGTWHWPVLK